MALDATGYGSGLNAEAIGGGGSSNAGDVARGIGVATGILASLGSAIAMSVSRGRQKLEGISIMGIDEFGKVVIPQQAMQWWPETLTDGLAVGWNAKQIPGASHDVMQWGQNGGRSIAFTARLSRTLRPDDDFNAVGTGIGKVPITARGINPSATRDLPQNVDIKRMIKYLRAYCYPAYTPSRQARPPVTAILHIPGLGLSETGDRDYIFAVMTACDVSYQRLFADGTPRLAEVSLAFKQVVQDVDGVHWKGRDELLDAANIRTGFSSGIAVSSDRGDLPRPPLP